MIRTNKPFSSKAINRKIINPLPQISLLQERSTYPFLNHSLMEAKHRIQMALSYSLKYRRQVCSNLVLGISQELREEGFGKRELNFTSLSKFNKCKSLNQATKG